MKKDGRDRRGMTWFLVRDGAKNKPRGRKQSKDKDDRSSKEEDDSELKTVLECVSVAFTTWSGSREIITLNCDVDIQSAPRKLVETNPAASSGPVRTAPQDSKTVIDMDKHLHKIGGKTLLKKEANDEHDGFTEGS
ncbi:unnamed protein product [Brassica oleracea var. botrytis]